jgi:6-phosphogluconolactonase
MRKNCFALAVLLTIGFILSGCLSTDGSAAADKYRVYFGTFNTTPGTGIYKAVLDVKAGTLSEATLAGEAVRAGFLAIHPDGKHLYAVGELGGFKGKSPGSVSAFEIDTATGNLKAINSQPVGGPGPCHLIVDPTGRNVLSAQYSGGSCTVVPIAKDGSLRSRSSFHQHVGGSGVVERRQNAPHAHSINLDPAGRIAVVADLGLDQVVIYQFDPAAGTLTPNDPPFVKTAPGGGPRHFIFHPSGEFGYTNLEITSQVTAFKYDAASGTLTPIQTLPTLPKGYTDRNSTAEIRVTPDGRFLYVSNRGHNSIAMYAIDQKTGNLTSLGNEPTRGEVPRNFNLDPTGSYLIAVHQKSNNATLFKVNKKTGKLEFTGGEIEVPKSVCVRFLPIQ